MEEVVRSLIGLLLPLYVLAGLVLVARRPSPETGRSWPEAVALGAGWWGALVAVSTEALGAFEFLTAEAVWLVWLGAAIVVALLLRSRVEGCRGLPARGVRRESLQRHTPLVGLAALTIAGVLALLLIALVSPPNNTDSMLYHLPRVNHWIQNRSLRHYATAYDHQLWTPPFAESVILHFRLLMGNDRSAALVQWLAMVGSLLLTWGIARRLGGNVRHAAFSLAFSFSLPMGILQATSSKNDYVTGFWLLCLAYFALASREGEQTRTALLGLALALGLGMLTKGTFYPLALPFLLDWTWRQLAPLRGSRLARIGVVAVVAGGLNLPQWGRNLGTYGHPLGPIAQVETLVALPRSPGAFLGRVLREAALHLATPSESLNRWLGELVANLAARLGDSGDFHLLWLWNHEDFAGNPMHLALILLAGLGLLWLWRQRRVPRSVGWYWLLSLTSFAAFSAVLAWQPFNVRLQLPFFLLCAPWVGVVLGGLLPDRWGWWLAYALVLLATPWIVLNRTRPLVGLQPRTSVGSVLTEPPERVLFANWQERRDFVFLASRLVSRSGCQRVGLWIDSHDWEYPFWRFLGAPESGVRIEVLEPLPHLESYRDQSFEPCAVIVTVPVRKAQVFGLPRLEAFGDVVVYGDPKLFRAGKGPDDP